MAYGSLREVWVHPDGVSINLPKELVNSHIVDESGLPYLDKSYQDKPALTTLTDNIPHTDLEVFTDPRLDISTGRFDVPFIGTGRFLLSWMGGYVISLMVVLI